MHGQPTIKYCNVKQVKQIYQYKKSPFLTGAQDSHLQRVTIPEAAHIQLRRGPPDDEQG
jgi:hypothetical protein